LPPAVVSNRNRLLAIMQQAGFGNYSHEWWHFTLENEPYEEQRFDFPVE
jgi:D-alanyl-D-alanine dipeptidase